MLRYDEILELLVDVRNQNAALIYYMCASRLRSDWSCKYYFTGFSVFEEMERWGRQIVTLQRWQIHVGYGGRSAHISICLIRHQYVTGFVPAVLLLCNALPALLGCGGRLGASSTKLQESLAPWQSHPQKEISLLHLHGTTTTVHNPWIPFPNP